VRLDSTGGCEVLELNITMPEDGGGAPAGKALGSARRGAGVAPAV
jgi:hypothetical protein